MSRPSLTEVERRIIGLREACPTCGEKFIQRGLPYIEAHWNMGHFDTPDPVETLDIKNTAIFTEIAKRNPVDYRYDILDADFLLMLAKIAHYGGEKYGYLNWQKSRLAGVNSPINHIYEHLREYSKKIPYDHFDGSIIYHLGSIAFNAMMESYYTKKEQEDNDLKSKSSNRIPTEKE